MILKQQKFPPQEHRDGVHRLLKETANVVCYCHVRDENEVTSLLFSAPIYSHQDYKIQCKFFFLRGEKKKKIEQMRRDVTPFSLNNNEVYHR